MNKPDEQEKTRQYVLGEIGGDDRSAIEERIMTEEDYFQELAMVEESLIQDYVDGTLDPADRANFEKCFLISAENRQKVKFARALRKYVNETKAAPEPKKKPAFFDSLKAFFSSPVPATLGVLIILGFTGFFIWKSVSVSTDSEILIALNKAYRAERPVESRITDLDYAPPKNTRGGANDADKTDKIERDLAKMLALKAVSENPSAENLHALGRVYLAEKNFDDAIEQFEKAVKLAPADAKLRNDLGVALMEKAKLSDQGKLENLAKANEEFANTIELDKNLLDAYFNRALTIQALNLPNQAREAWQKYLELDSTSQWAEEARKNLETLETTKPVSKTKEEILQEFLQARQTGDHESAWQTLSRNREMITGKLIPQQLAFLFVDAKSDGDEIKAKEYLEALIYAGKLEEEKSGDLLWRDLAKFYNNISGNQIVILKNAQTIYFDASKLENEGKLEKSIIKFETVRNLFHSTNNTIEEKLCDYWIGSLNFRLNQLEQSEKIFKSSVGYANENNYKWLATHAYVRLAFISGSKNNHSESIEYCNLALDLANQTNDQYNLQRIFYALSYNYRCLRRYDVSLDYSERSFKIASETSLNLTLLWDIFDSITMTLFEKELNNTAIFFQKEALKISEDITDKFAEHLSKINLGMIYAKVNEYDKAKTLFEESKNIADGFEDTQAREKGLALINLKLANLERMAGNHYKAAELFRQASNFYVSSEFHLNEYESRKGELLCYFDLKNDGAIQEYIPIVLEIFKKYRSEILEEQNRNSFFDNEQGIYDLAISYEYSKGNNENAFNYSEDSKSRSLLDLVGNKAEIYNQEIKFSKEVYQPRTLEQIRTQLPDNTQIIQYSILENKVLIWLIGKSEFYVTDIKISNKELDEKISNYLKALSQKDDSQENLAKGLYQLLIKPVADKLSQEKQICVIADKFLFHLPFAALLSPETNRYLITDYDLLFAPSANVFLAGSEKAKRFDLNSSENILVVGNPSFNQSVSSNRNLPNLPDAENEAKQIGKIYQHSKVLIGKETDKLTIKDYFSKSEIIHFAGHYVVDEVSPMKSRFILKEDETLDNLEIFNEDLFKTKLIILSACQTGIERYYQGEGMIGAARTFLAKGIPIVLASQWNVDSEATSELMIRFHNYRKNERISSVRALRKSQIDLINGENENYKSPYYWAAFEIFGGDTQF